MTQAITFKLPDTLGREVLSYLPQTVSYNAVSKAFAVWNKKLMEREWQALAKNPLLEKQVAAIQGEISLCFKRLFTEQKEAFLTSTFYDAFIRRQAAFTSSYTHTRFEKGAGFLLADAKEQDGNLERAWVGKDYRGIRYALGLKRHAPDLPKTAKEIRAYLDKPAHQAVINDVGDLNLSELQLTGIPVEIAKFSRLHYLWLSENRIHKVPKEVANLKELHGLNLSDNCFDHIPDILFRCTQAGYFSSNNRITVFSEEDYDRCFSLSNWLGKPLDANGACEVLFMLSLFPFSNRYSNGYISVSKEYLKEIPFALWLREKLLIPNLFQLVVGIDRNDIPSREPNLVKQIAMYTCFAISVILAPVLWVLNQFLSLVVAPVVTKVRELLGYGRMMRLD